MVTTRRQEQLQQSGAGLVQHEQQRHETDPGAEPVRENRAASPRRSKASPLTPDSPRAASSPRAAAGRLQQQQQQGPAKPKSALKMPRSLAEVAADHILAEDHLGAYDEVTPLQTIKKRVRIHSGNNIIHVFGNSSCNSGDAVAGADGVAEETPQSRFRFGGGFGSTPARSSALPHYQAFIQSVIGQRAQQGTQQSGEVGHAGGWAADGNDSQHHDLQQQQRRRGGGRGGSHGKHLPWAAVLSISLWMVVSSALIFVNKTLMVDRSFRFPFALTALGQAASTLLGWLVGQSGLVPMQRKRPTLPVIKILPVAFCSAATLFLGNYAYLGLSVAFINILKALTPAVTLGCSVALGVERPSLQVTASLGLVALGTSIATAQETGTSHFSWLAFVAFMLSMLFEALRVVLAERLLGKAQQRYSPMEVLVYIGPLIFVFLLLGAFATEWQGLRKEGLAILVAHPLHFAVACLVSFLVNACSFFAIQTSSSLTFKVAGCVKNCFVVLVGVLLGDELTLKEALGYGLSMLGFLSYTFLRSPAGQNSQLKRA